MNHPASTTPRSLAVATLLALAACRPAPATAPPTATRTEPVKPAPSEPSPVAYTLAPVLESGKLTALAVEMRLTASATGVTRIGLPETWADARELWRHVDGFAVEGAAAVREDGPQVRVVDSPAGAPLVVRYRVRSAYDREPTSDDGQLFAPVIRPDWCYVFGEALFAVVEGDLDRPARFTWTGPAGFNFASDLEHITDAQPVQVGDILESIVMAGDRVQLLSRADGGGAVRVAIVGDYGFTRAAFVDLAMAVVTSQRAFWGDHGEPFLIALAPQLRTPNNQSYGGTGRSDAFALSAAEDVPFDRLRHLLAHEYTHTWNPRRLGGFTHGQAEGAEKWFTEGFTEFYTWRLLLRAGLYTLEEFVADWNDALLEYATSPARAATNADIARDYWNDRAIGRIPYRRGPLLAAMWDQRLRLASDGKRDLDDVVLAMRQQVREEKQPGKPAAQRFRPTYEQLGGPDLGPDAARYIEQGAPIELPADVFGPCITVVSEKRRSFERGWDSDATSKAGDVITGLRAGSPAHRAGLRDGMQIVERLAGEPGNSTVAYVLKVRDGERERKIKFKPEGETELVVQRLVIDRKASKEQREACTRALAGLSAADQGSTQWPM